MSPAQPLWLSSGSTDRPSDLHVALVELRLELRDRAELGRADRREVLRVREQHAPAVAEVVVEVDRAFGGLGREVGGFVAQSERHAAAPLSSRDLDRSRSTGRLDGPSRPKIDPGESGFAPANREGRSAYDSPADRAVAVPPVAQACDRHRAAAGVARLPAALARRAALADRQPGHARRAVRAGRPAHALGGRGRAHRARAAVPMIVVVGAVGPQIDRRDRRRLLHGRAVRARCSSSVILLVARASRAIRRSRCSTARPRINGGVRRRSRCRPASAMTPNLVPARHARRRRPRSTR